MKKTLILSVLALGMMFTSCGKSVSSLKTEKDSAAYAIGVSFGTQLHGQIDSTFDVDAVVAGVRDVFAKNPGMTLEQAHGILDIYFQKKQQDMMKEQQVKFSKDSIANAEESAKYMESKLKEGFQKTASGVLYKITNEGTGTKSELGDTLRVHYTLTLPNGEKKDSSVDRGEPMVFPLEEGGMVKGFIEAMTLLNKGTKAIVVIPASLGYGERGNSEMGGPVGPEQALTFELEMIDIKKPSKK